MGVAEQPKDIDMSAEPHPIMIMPIHGVQLAGSGPGPGRSITVLVYNVNLMDQDMPLCAMVRLRGNATF